MELIGKIVTPRAGTVLRCGGGYYRSAICVSENPFVIVSESFDMLWAHSGFKPENFYIGCDATSEARIKALKRWEDHKIELGIP